MTEVAALLLTTLTYHFTYQLSVSFFKKTNTRCYFSLSESQKEKIMQQVITVRPDGSIEGLLHKKGKGINLLNLGKGEVRRASLIEFDEKAQKFYVDVQHKQIAGKLTYNIFLAVIPVHPEKAVPIGFADGSGKAVMLFDTYEDAVEVEIAYLNKIRLNTPSLLED